MEVQGPPRLGNPSHHLQSPTLQTGSIVCFSCGACAGITPFCPSFCFFWYLFLLFLLLLLLGFVIPSSFYFCRSLFSSFLSLKIRKISRCKVRLRLVWVPDAAPDVLAEEPEFWCGKVFLTRFLRSQNCSSDTTRPTKPRGI